jgi:hypothetical protein
MMSAGRRAALIASGGLVLLLTLGGQRQTNAGIAVQRVPSTLAIGAKGDQTYPGVASARGQYLVVWNDTRNGFPSDIYGTRVSGTGRVLDPGGIAIARSPPVGTGDGAPAVSSDGTNYLVDWYDGRGNAPPHLIFDVTYGTRVARDGQVLDPDGFWIPAGSAGPVGFDGANYLVVWSTDTGIYGARATPGGTTLDGNGITISTGTRREVTGVAFDGTNYLVVWDEYVKDEEGHGPIFDIRAKRVSPAGVLLDASSISISTAAHSQSDPAVASDGSNFLVLWTDGRNDTTNGTDIYGTRVTPAGVVLDPDGRAIAAGPGGESAPALASDGSGYLAVWQNSRFGQSDIYGARVSSSGVLAAVRILFSTRAPCQVPEVKRHRLRDARRRIAAAGCRLGTVRLAYSMRIGKGRVISQRPRPGARVDAGTPVALIVSRGRKS